MTLEAIQARNCLAEMSTCLKCSYKTKPLVWLLDTLHSIGKINLLIVTSHLEHSAPFPKGSKKIVFMKAVTNTENEPAIKCTCDDETRWDGKLVASATTTRSPYFLDLNTRRRSRTSAQMQYFHEEHIKTKD